MANIFLNSVWPEWQVERRLGGGTYGSVYKVVRRDQIESYAAVKVIPIPKDETDVDTLRSEGMRYEETETYFKNVVDDFVKEIELMLTFKGAQNIVSVEDYKVIKRENEIGWDIYIRMELLNTLEDYFRDHYPDESEIIKIGVDICTALEKCSQRGVIHRDIKPDNILVDSFGDFKLGDFGIARTLGNASVSMTQVGTPNYMAPEIAKSRRYDATVDTYSLGIVLYRYANNNLLPFIEPEQNTSPMERQKALTQRLEGRPLYPPCGVSRALAEVILTACSYDPSMRYKTPTEMKNALISVANGTYRNTGIYELTETQRIVYDEAEETRPVRQAEYAQSSGYQVERFDSSSNPSNARPHRELNTRMKPEYERQQRTIRNIKITIAVCAVVGVLILVFGMIIPQLPKIDRYTNGNSSSSDETIEYSKSDEEKIAAIIQEAESIASNDDLDGAYAKVQEGLLTYPGSSSLMAKQDEYYNAIYKRDTLATAKVFADMDSLPEAIATIKEAQIKRGDCIEYSKALKEYSDIYKASIIEKADNAVAENDYITAIDVISDSMAILGENAELSAKLAVYESKYITEVICKADSFIASRDYESARKVLASALESYPNNAQLKAKMEILKNSMPVDLLVACPPFQTEDYEAPEKLSVGGVEYRNSFALEYYYGAKGYAMFNLGKKYQTLEFDIGHVDGTTMEDVDICIYLDEKLYDERTLQSTDMPQYYCIDVTGITQFRITISECRGYVTSYGIVNAVLV